MVLHQMARCDAPGAVENVRATRRHLHCLLTVSLTFSLFSLQRLRTEDWSPVFFFSEFSDCIIKTQEGVRAVATATFFFLLFFFFTRLYEKMSAKVECC